MLLSSSLLLALFFDNYCTIPPSYTQFHGTMHNLIGSEASGLEPRGPAGHFVTAYTPSH